ncbi:hypothetical protein BDP27DRAFT_1434069 [Rhodocollybia butyracea]|uniref:Uncharacterized protein n=1 Tax=Rhodocollybia butyracea TaxID=206335 RepID=A0A9P5P756_9AGAR|nr:hypothetical protein BDP27DRAFT_1434069 [Rhodocollybia butyracea]
MATPPFPCPPTTSSLQTLVDDSDPRISYSDGCSTNVTATLNFNGIGVQVFGTVGNANGSPSSTYQIDDLPSSTFVFQANGQNNYRIPFYVSPLLNEGNHTLVMTALGNSNSRIWLDYILSTNGLASSSSETSIPSASASLTLTPSSTNTTAIVGGVLGSVVGIILVIIFAYFMLRQRRKHADRSVTITPYDGLVNHIAAPAHSVSASDVSRQTNPFRPVITTSASQYYPTYAQEALIVSENRNPPVYEP